MSIVGFNFSKIVAERKEMGKGNINIKNNVVVKEVKERDLALGTDKQKALQFLFEFSSKYEPNVANILLEGDVLLIEDSKRSKEILDEWKKSKKVNREVMGAVLNTVLNRCNIQALILSQDINLPPPIPLPKLTEQGKK